MTHLRKIMLEELGRSHTQATTRYYIRAVEDFSRRFNRPPDCLGPQHIREYHAELLHSGHECRWTATFADGMVDSTSLPVFCYPVLKLEVRVPAALNSISECLQHQLLLPIAPTLPVFVPRFASSWI